MANGTHVEVFAKPFVNSCNDSAEVFTMATNNPIPSHVQIFRCRSINVTLNAEVAVLTFISIYDAIPERTCYLTTISCNIVAHICVYECLDRRKMQIAFREMWHLP